VLSPLFISAETCAMCFYFYNFFCSIKSW